MLGRDLYETFFYGYTKKQWGCEPKDLPASILKRLPVRFDYNDNYYNSQFQGIPVDGYTSVVQSILDHPQIEVKLSSKLTQDANKEFDWLVWSGPLDAYYEHCYGQLGYRTVYWEQTVEQGDYQGNAVINYTDIATPWTRIHEHKHFAPWETHEQTVIYTEFSKATGKLDVPYYPMRLAKDMTIYRKYSKLANSQHKSAVKGVSFIGRLGTYRYLDMDKVIGEALAFGMEFLSSISQRRLPPLSSDQNF